MKLIAVTGGIASGKSTVVRLLAGQLRCPWMSCDDVVHGILSESDWIERIRERFGPEVVNESGIDRRELGKRVFERPEERDALEALLHPEVLRRVSVWARGEAGVSLGLVEVPLLYEVDFPMNQDFTVVVACSRATQVTRLRERNGLSLQDAEARLSAQLPLISKTGPSDLVIWNDGTETALHRQVSLAAACMAHQLTMTENSPKETLVEEPGTEEDGAPTPEERQENAEARSEVGAVPEKTEEPAERASSGGKSGGDQPEDPGSSEGGEAVGEEEAEEAKPPVDVPECLDLNELQTRPLSALHHLAVDASLRVAGIRSKHQLIVELLHFYTRHGTRVEVEGIVEIENGSNAVLRYPKFSFTPLPDDLHVPVGVMKKFGLRPGNKIRCTARPPRDRERYFAVDEVLEIEGIPADVWETPKPFDKLTPLFPKERIILEGQKENSVASRIVDLIAPLGKGQRGLINAPPRGGKTLLLKDIAAAIHQNHPEVELIVLLLDERPEEVTDFRETVQVDVFSSTFDEQPKRHIQVAEMVSERAKRLVELGKDVVILLDSLTRLARGYNRLQGGGRIMSGGVGAKALEKPRKFFGAARNVEEGGSLTILATALIETENRMDEVIFEEFKGTGNMEISLDRELVEKRIFPAIHLQRSGTRNDEKLYHPDEFRRITVLRRELAQVPAVEAIQVLSRNIQLTSSNAELLLKGLK